MKPPRKKASSSNQAKSPTKPAFKVSTPQKSLSRRKLWIFRLFVAVGVPFIFLATTELVLRLAGFGYPTGFLLKSQVAGQPVFVQNNRFGWRFFGPTMARIPEPFCVPCVKPPNTVRIVVFGESAAQGDPQPAFGVSRMLQAMLELRYPGTHFEVINAAMVAINSNVILPIARDCTALNADVWVIYMGNNEVVGPFGAGTVFGQQTPPLPLIRADLALKSTRVGQLMDAVVRRLHKSPMNESQWGGMEMFLNQQVRAGDPRMNAVYNHFARNLSDIIRAGRHSGAGIVVSTVAVNLDDCPPFASQHRPGLTDTDKNKWDAYYDFGVAAQTAGRFPTASDFQEAGKKFGEAALIDNDYAELRFRQGLCAQELGKTADAEKQFAAARDFDTLRFRCDSRLNDLIRKTVTNDNDPEIVLADTEQTFADERLLSDGAFYEHVHLNFYGNYELARSLAVKLEGLLPKAVTAQVPASRHWPPMADCARRLAWSQWDEEQADAEIYSRLKDPPFTGELSRKQENENELYKYKSDIERLSSASPGAGIQAAEEACQEALALAPDDPVVREQLAVLQQSSGDLTGAMTNAQRAVELLPTASEDWSQLGTILGEEHQYDDAAAAFRRAYQLNPEGVWALKNLAQSLNDLGQTNEAMNEYRRAVTVNPQFGPAWLGLGQMYEKMGNKAEAADCYQKALSNRVKNGAELTTLARFCQSRGWYEAAATNFEDALGLSPGDAMLDIEAGQNFAAINRRADAERLFYDAVQSAPNLMEAHYLYGIELGRDGDAVRAADQFREAVRIMPNLPEARLNLGIALENANNYSDALAQFEKVLSQDPSNAIALSHAQALREKLAQAH